MENPLHIKYEDTLRQGTDKLNKAIDYATESRTLAQEGKENADAAAIEAREAAGEAGKAAERANTAASELEGLKEDVDEAIENADSFIYVKEYDPERIYNKNNMATYDGSTYIALEENKGVLPSDSTRWGLVARRGVDGMGAVASINNLGPSENGNITLTAAEVGAASAQEMNDVSQRVETIEKYAKTYREKQSTLLSEFYRKLRNGIFPIKACFQGDSIIYGYDTNSSDRRPPLPTLSGDGSAHTRERAGKTITEALEEFLGVIYGTGNITLINRGFSGDTAQASYNHWPAASGANVNFIMLGTNDSNPSNNVSIEDFMRWYRKIIERELENNTPVVLLTPTKKRSATDLILGSYVDAVFKLGDEYGIPVIDMQEMLANLGYDSYSDGTHFNTKGNTYIAARLVSLFIGSGVLNKKSVTNKTSLSVRPNVDNVKYLGAANIASTTGYVGPDELAEGQGIAASILDGGSIIYSFYTETPDLLFVPSVYFGNAQSKLKIEVDFGVELPNVTNGYDRYVRRALPTWRPTNPVYLDKDDDNWQGAPTLRVYTLPGVKDYDEEKVVHITTKGWHTVKISCIDSGSMGVRLHAVNFLHINDLLERRKKGFLKIKTHSTYTDNNNIANTTIKLDDLLDSLDYPAQSSYWENPPLKVTISNWDNNILEYALIIGNPTGTAFKLGLEPRETKIVANPNPEQVRTLTGVNYNPTTGDLTFSWGGATTRATEITITMM